MAEYNMSSSMEALHSAFPFKTNMQIIPTQEMKIFLRLVETERHYSKSKKRKKRQIPYISRVLGVFSSCKCQTQEFTIKIKSMSINSPSQLHAVRHLP